MISFQMICVFARLCRYPTASHKVRLRKPLLLLPASSLVKNQSAITVQQDSSWIHNVIENLKIFLRSVQMAVLLTPLVITAPLAIYFPQRCQDIWLKLLVKTIQVCGPVYIKLGQWASTRRDLFHPKLCDHLSKLQRQAKVHAWKHTEQTLAENGMENTFEEFDPVPIGSGCCAQVYKAKYQGQHVAVKVLHPNIKENFLRDLTVLRSLINGVSWLFPNLHWLSVKESLEEFSALMNIQVDLRNEVKSLEKFHRNFQGDANVRFPRPILSRQDVLVESFEQGVDIGTLLQDLDSVSTSRRKDLASKGVQMFLKMVFRHNFVHCDLHPGNILVSPNADNLVILDPGLTASLSPRDMNNFR